MAHVPPLLTKIPFQIKEIPFSGQLHKQWHRIETH